MYETIQPAPLSVQHPCIRFAPRSRDNLSSTPLCPPPTAHVRGICQTHLTPNTQHPCICFACVKSIQPSLLLISLCCPSPNASARGIQRPTPNSHLFALLCVCENHPAAAPLCSFPFLRHHHLSSSQRQQEVHLQRTASQPNLTPHAVRALHQ